MRIAVDAMGSDRAPYMEVHGAVLASMATGVEVVLVGDSSELKPTLAVYRKSHRVSIVHASEVVGMAESPVAAVRKKKDSSIAVAMRLMKEGQVDGVVSAGNTGAVMVTALMTLRTLPGVSRCPICQEIPTAGAPALLLDVGANVDCGARFLCEFAEMGMVYSERALGVSNPRVGLLNIGEEQAKGNDVLKTVHSSLSTVDHINFVGNIEPGALYKGAADVVVCDGLHGNLVLKTSEAVASLMASALRKELTAGWISRFGALLSMGAFRRFKRRADPNEHYGAPLLGVNGTVIIGHGSSSAQGIMNLIFGARRAIETGVNEHIREGLERLRQATPSLPQNGVPA